MGLWAHWQKAQHIGHVSDALCLFCFPDLQTAPSTSASPSPTAPAPLVRRASERLTVWLRSVANARGAALRRGVQKQLAPTRGRLREEQLKLESVAGAIETEFIATGERLETTARLADRLARGADQLESLVAGSPGETHPVQAVAELVRESIHFLQNCQLQNETLLDELQACGARIGAVEQKGQELDRVFFGLRTVEVSFRVETAVLPAEARGVFQSLTGGMAKLQLEVEASFGREFERLAAARGTLAGLRENLGGRPRPPERGDRAPADGD